jgi:hypothetical protein
MDLRRPGKILLFISLFSIAADAAAQAGFDGGTPCARASHLESEIQERCEEGGREAVVIRHELELTTQFDGRVVQTRQCQAEVSLSYAQQNTVASVEGKIENTTCGASSGNLVLSVRTANEGGEQSTQEFSQTWMREDDQPVTFSAEYPIGENVDLVRVRALRLRCTCAVGPQAAAGPAD